MESTKDDSPMSKPKEGEKEENVLDLAASYNISSWSDMKNFDNVVLNSDKKEVTECQGGWYEEEERKMAAEFGNFIRVTYANEQMDYICTICQIHSNSRRSLGIHCNGMKHLKKKKQYDEENGMIPPSIPMEDAVPPPKKRFAADSYRYEESGPPKGNHRGFPDRGFMTRGSSRPYGNRPREDYRPERYFGNNEPRGRGYDDRPSGRSFYDRVPGRGSYDNGPRGRGYDDGPRGRGYDDGPRGRGYDDGPRGRGYDDGPRGRGYDDGPRGRSYDDGPRGRNYDDDRRRGFSDYSAKQSPSRDIRTSEVSRGHHSQGSVSYRHLSDDKYRNRSPQPSGESRKTFWNDDPDKAGGRDANGRAHVVSPPIGDESRMPPLPPSYSRLSDIQDEARRPRSNSYRKWSPEILRRPPIDDILPNRFRDYDSPNQKSMKPAEDTLAQFRAPSPPKVDLRQGSRSDSLTQLSKIAILSPEDAKTGISVVSSVLKSLKNYYQVKANWKAVDLLIDAELKIGSVAALETSVKMQVGSPKKELYTY